MHQDPRLTQEQREIWDRGLRVLARIIARSYLVHLNEGETSGTGEESAPESGRLAGQNSELPRKEGLDVA